MKVQVLYKVFYNYFLSMKDKKIKVAVVYNEAHPEFYKIPESTEKVGDFQEYFEVENLTPMEEYEMMAKKLSRAGLDAYTLNIKDNFQAIIDDINQHKPDVVFNFVEIYKEIARYEMNIVGLYELLGISYTGAPPLALANCQSKALTKRILSEYGIRTPRFKVFRRKLKAYKSHLKYPVIVKPAYEDASVGIENESIVSSETELKERIEYVFQHFNQPALCEEFIDGRELNVAVLGDKNPKVLPISEIDFKKMPDHLYNIVSYQAKWDPLHESYHKTIPICPAKLPRRVEEKAKKMALAAFKVMGVRDYSRVDMRLSKDNHLYVLEVNPNPDLTEGAGFMRSAATSGLSYTAALKKIVMLAYERGKRKGHY